MEGPNRLERALALFLDWQHETPQRPFEDLVRAHEDLEDYLLSLAEGDADDESGADGAQRLGDFELRREIGRGGMGVVYEAQQTSLGRSVALKVLAPHLTHSATSLARFTREATTAARLEHRGIVRVLGFGEEGDTHFLAMDLVDGAPLDRVLRELRTDPSDLSGPRILDAVRANRIVNSNTATATDASDSTNWSWHGGYVEKVVAITAQVADALAYAHTAGVIHRDVKPSNILVCESGRVVLTDFGLAREADAPSITVTGDFAGTPYYVSPEQIRADPRKIDHRTDVFSLGTTLYELLTLERPFTGETSHEITARILDSEPRNPTAVRATLAPDLVAIVLKALEKDPADRYASADDLAADLRAFLDYRPISARRRGALSRASRWVRREPFKAALALLLLVSATLVVYVGTSQSATKAGYAALETERIDELLGEITVATVSRQRATDAVEEILRMDPGHPYAILTGAWSAFSLGDPRAAIGLIDTHRVAGRADAAIDRMRARIQYAVEPDDALVERIKAPPTDAADCFVMGIVTGPRRHVHSHVKDALARAAEYFEDAILRSDRAQLPHYVELAFATSRLDDDEMSRRCADSLKRLWPDAPIAHMAAGIALTWVDNATAIADLERAVTLDPELQPAWRNLSVAHSQAGDLDAAIEAMERAIELAPSDAGAHSQLSMQLSRRGDMAAAAAAAQRSVDLAPDSALFRGQLAAMLERHGDIDGAWREIHEAKRLAPRVERTHRGVLNLARIRGDEQAMRDEAFRWVRVHPGGPTAHRELSQFLLEHGASDRDEQIALSAARRAVELSSGDDAFCWLALAHASHRHGLDAEVGRALEEAKMNLPQDQEQRAAAIGEIRNTERALGLER